MNQGNIEFFVNNFCFLNSAEEADVSFISPIARRRLSAMDKCALNILNNIYSDDIQSLVFSSRKGEVERLIKIINQYTTEGEVSPNTFSGSVHNYPVGFFLLDKQKAIPYTAISGTDNSISTGLLAAIASKYNNILFCYTDIFEAKCFGFGINISKSKIKNETINNNIKYRITLNNLTGKDNFDEFKDLFSKNKDVIKTSLFKLERV